MEGLRRKGDREEKLESRCDLPGREPISAETQHGWLRIYIRYMRLHRLFLPMGSSVYGPLVPSCKVEKGWFRGSLKRIKQHYAILIYVR
jgi:hypothetical protein